MTKWKYKQQVSLGYDASGKRVRRWAKGNSVAELNRNIVELQKEFDSIRNPSDITFDDYAQKWLQTYKAHKELNTFEGYRHSVDKCSAIAGIRIKDIRKTDLQQIINDNIDHPATCRKLALTMKQIFDTALDDGIIAVSPALKLELPKVTPNKKRALTETERTAIRDAELKPSDRFFLDLLYYCGLRRGEALALTRSDFDFKAFLLCVSKSVAYDGERPTVKTTKTAVTRYVPIPSAKVEEWKSVLSAMPFVIFSRQDKHYTKTFFRGMWARIRKAVNIRLTGSDTLTLLNLTPHMVRHDYATRLYYVPGISTKKKAEILGHSERLFLELYSHLDTEKEDLETFQRCMNF